MKILRFVSISFFLYTTLSFPISISLSQALIATSHYHTFHQWENFKTVIAHFVQTQFGSRIVKCEPLSPESLIRYYQTTVNGQNHISEKDLCQSYHCCALSDYRSYIEKLGCFDQVALELTERAKYNDALAVQMKSTILDNGQTALDYYQQKALHARARGVTLTENSRSIILQELREMRIEQLRATFTPNKIAAEEAGLAGLQETLHPSQAKTLALRQQMQSNLQVLKQDKETVHEVTYDMSAKSEELAQLANIAHPQMRLGYAVQQDIHRAIVQELNEIAALPITHNAVWAEGFKKQAVAKLADAMHATNQGNMTAALKAYDNACDIKTYLQKVADGSIDYEKHFSTRSLNQLKQAIQDKIRDLNGRIDPSFFASQDGELLPAKTACAKTCHSSCQRQVQHHEQRELRKQINGLSKCRNAIDEVIKDNHMLTVADYSLSGTHQNNALPMHVVGNKLEHFLCQQGVELANIMATQVRNPGQELLLANTDLLIRSVGNGQSPVQYLDGLDLVTTYRSWPTEYLASIKTGATQDAQSLIVQKLNEQLDEILREVRPFVNFGKGIVDGWLDGGAAVADIINHPEKLPTDLREKIIAFNTAVRKVGGVVAQHLQDRFTLSMGKTEQERLAAAQRMYHRAGRALLWAQALAAKLSATSPHDAGHVLGRGAFDISTFNASGNGLNVAIVALQEARLAETVLEYGKEVSQALEQIVQKLDAMTMNFAKKAATALEPEVAVAGTSIKNSWQLLKQEAERFVGGAGKVAGALNEVKNNYELMKKFVAASKTVDELVAKHGPEIQKIIESVAEKCKSIGLKVPDLNTFQHVISGHMEGGAAVFAKPGKIKSIFVAGEDWLKLGIETWEKGTFVGEGVKIYDFGRTIGISGAGKPISVVRIVVRDERWLTIYPWENAIKV